MTSQVQWNQGAPPALDAFKQHISWLNLKLSVLTHSFDFVYQSPFKGIFSAYADIHVILLSQCAVEMIFLWNVG